MPRFVSPALIALLAALLAACGATPGAAGPTATALPAAGDQPATAPPAPLPTGGPGGSDIVPTVAAVLPPLSEAELAASATAFAMPTIPPTEDSVAYSGTATADAAISATGTALAFTPAMSETATAAAATINPQPPIVTRTPVVGMPQVLPAPIYLLASEPPQVFRVEPDGANYRQLTFEQQPVVELAVAAEAGTLFYLTGDPDGAERTLLALDGAGRRPLLYGQLSDLVVSPDGRRVFVRIDNPEPGLIVGQDASPAGVWSTTPDGGRPGLVVADTPADGRYDDAAPAWTYTPIAVSPDGARLALFAYDRDGTPVPGGELVIVGDAGAPVRAPVCCEAPVWAADSAGLFAAAGGPAPDTSYGLTYIDATTGATTPILDGTGETIPLVTALFVAGDGQLYGFVDLAPAQGFSWEYRFRPELTRIGQAGSLTPLAPPGPPPLAALGEARGSGALIVAFAPQYNREDQLFWQPADSRAATLIPFAGGDVAWVPANGPLTAGDCGAFNPLRYQAGAARQVDPGVYDLQGRLRALGFDAGSPDGLYGEQTRDGVAAFQTARGLPASGDVDCATWQAMLW